MRYITGIQASGNLHLGNYFGAMKPMIDLQEKHELFTMIVDYHSMTSISDGKILRDNTLKAAATYLALGLDPNKTVFWKQSSIPEVHELSWFLSNFTPMGLLERCHSYKDKIAKGIAPNHGLFAYPVLMAADILLFGAEKVPVGKDQKQHVEVARDIAIKFNNQYGNVFKIPEPVIDDDVGLIPGIDGQKMSKSYNNHIELFVDLKATRKRIMSVVTDSKGVDEAKDFEKCNVYNIIKFFLTNNEIKALEDRYKNPPLGYGEVKLMLFEKFSEFIEPKKTKYDDLVSHPDTIRDILSSGEKKAREKALEVLGKCREVTGIAW